MKIFCAVHHNNWEQPALVESWRTLTDELESWDWGREGFNQYAPGWYARMKPEMNRRLFARVKASHECAPIDVFFSYLSGRIIYPETISKIAALGIKTVNISLDDTLLFEGRFEHGFFSGCADLAPVFDLNVTCQNFEDVIKYEQAGGKALFSWPGCVPDELPSGAPIKREPFISFIGQAYGARLDWIEQLRGAGLPIVCHGHGWPNGPLTRAAMIQMQQRATINLGFGFIGDTERLGLKGRDFEAPLMGGLYVTTKHPELNKAFHGHEIETFSSPKEMIDLCAQNLDAYGMGLLARTRCLKEHTWKHRFERILKALAQGEEREHAAA